MADQSSLPVTPPGNWQTRRSDRSRTPQKTWDANFATVHSPLSDSRHSNIKMRRLREERKRCAQLRDRHELEFLRCRVKELEANPKVVVVEVEKIVEKTVTEELELLRVKVKEL